MPETKTEPGSIPELIEPGYSALTVDIDQIPEGDRESPPYWKLVVDAATAKATPRTTIERLTKCLCDGVPNQCVYETLMHVKTKLSIENSSLERDPDQVNLIIDLLSAQDASIKANWAQSADIYGGIISKSRTHPAHAWKEIARQVSPLFVAALAENDDAAALDFILENLPLPYLSYRSVILQFMHQGLEKEKTRAKNSILQYLAEQKHAIKIGTQDWQFLIEDAIEISDDEVAKQSHLRELAEHGDKQRSLYALSQLDSDKNMRELNSECAFETYRRLQKQDLLDRNETLRLLSVLHRLDPSLIAAMLDNVSFIEKKEKGITHPFWKREKEILNDFQNQPMLDAGSIPHYKELLAKINWLRSEESNQLIQFSNSSTRNLHAGLCRLQQIRTLAWAIDYEGSDSKNLLLEDKFPNCPLHIPSHNMLSEFLAENLEPGNKIRVTLAGLYLFQKLAAESGQFCLSEKSLEFLTQRGDKPLRSWQITALHSWAAHGRQGLIAAATGSGKSLIGVAALLEAVEESYASVLLTHRLALKGQWKKDELRAISGARDVEGKITSSESQIFRTMPEGNLKELSSEDPKNLNYSLQPKQGEILLTLDKSLADRLHLLPSIDDGSLLVADEVHRFGGPGSSEIITHPFGRRLGLSATIDAHDFSIRTHFGEIVCDYDIGRAISEEVVSAFDLLTIRVPLSNVKVIYGKEKHEYAELSSSEKPSDKEIEEATFEVEVCLQTLTDAGFIPDEDEDFLHAVNRMQIEKSPEFADMARSYSRARRRLDSLTKLRSGESLTVIDILADQIERCKRTLIFANWNSEGQKIADQLKRANQNIRINLINADTEQTQRQNAFESIQNGSTDVLIAPRILDEGINIPNAQFGLILGPGTEGYRQIVQRAGRVLRKKPGNQSALIVLAAGERSSEDPHRRLPDSTHAILAKHAREVYVLDHTEISLIQEVLEKTLSD